MFNPIAELARHYGAAIKRWSPIKLRTTSDTVTIALLSERRRAPRTLTLFASDVEVSASHRAPGAYFSDEIRVRKARTNGAAGCLRIPRWYDGRAAYALGPLRVIVDTAARQARGYAACIVESAAERQKTPDNRASVYTLASRDMPDGSSQQREFDPEPA